MPAQLLVHNLPMPNLPSLSVRTHLLGAQPAYAQTRSICLRTSSCLRICSRLPTPNLIARKLDLLALSIIEEGIMPLPGVFWSTWVQCSRPCISSLRGRRSSGCSFLIPYSRVAIKNHSLTHFRLGASSVAAQLFRCFVLPDAVPYRLEGG